MGATNPRTGTFLTTRSHSTRKKHFRLSFQSPFSFHFCAKTTKIIFTKNPLANVVKEHVRLSSQPPFSFLFCAKTKKTVPTKNLLANGVKKHVRLIFSPAREIPNCFQTFRQSYLISFHRICHMQQMRYRMQYCIYRICCMRYCICRMQFCNTLSPALTQKPLTL